MDKLTIQIKPMTKSDVDGVLKIEEVAYGEHHWSADSFYNELSNKLARYYCAFLDEEMVGYAGCWQILEEVHITTIATKEEFKGRKIGEALLTSIINDCYKNMAKYITLEVRCSNIPAINLYSKYGFKSLGTRKGYYQNNNEDALVMWTENVFYDKFKLEYKDRVAELKGFITIK